jgi:hypothetical protein
LILAVALFLFVALGLLVLFFVLCLQVGAPVRCGEQRRPCSRPIAASSTALSPPMNHRSCCERLGVGSLSLCSLSVRVQSGSTPAPMQCSPVVSCVSRPTTAPFSERWRAVPPLLFVARGGVQPHHQSLSFLCWVTFREQARSAPCSVQSPSTKQCSS